MYKLLIRPLLFLLDAETIHHFTFKLLSFFLKIPGFLWVFKRIHTLQHPALETEVFGLKFPNPIGLAAGMDKNAVLIDGFAAMGFGFVEIGTLTPKPQAGNERPRLFRLKKDQAIINRMGFNNEGVEAAIQKLKKRQSKIIVGGNIGKNKFTPNHEATHDYLYCFEALFDYVDYFAINVSSPNTPGLRELQDKEPLTQLLQALQQKNLTKSTPKPILLKIAPDLTDAQLEDIIEIVKNTGITGVIATNTTIAREGLQASEDDLQKIGAGGLSGKPLANRSTEVIRYLTSKSTFPVIGVGGVHSPHDALEKLKAGASLVQIYTGLVYEGPGLCKRIHRTLLKNTY